MVCLVKRTSTPGRTAKVQAISLSPQQQTYARTRSKQAGITVSRYVQSLIDYDRTKNVLAAALTSKLNAGVA
jgi:hypothetical protein